jgi:glutathione peroxidase
MFGKIEVNGDGACDLYQWLKADHPDEADIAWNFTKFLVDRSGAVVARFDPTVTPEQIAEQLPEYL